MNSYNENEKCLKAFLKKKISYTAGLLVAFLITGAVSSAAAVGTTDASKLQLPEMTAQSIYTQSYENFMFDLQGEKAYVHSLIDENNKVLRQLDATEYTLLHKADFYSKPIYPSTQIFFIYDYLNSGNSKNKNKTKSEWRNTLGAIDSRMSGNTLPKGKNPYHKGEVISFNNGSMQSLGYLEDGSVDPNATYKYNNSAFNSGVNDIASYDSSISGYNPNLDPSSLPAATANRYMKPKYATDASGSQIVKNLLGTEPTVKDALGNTYYIVSETDPTTGVVTKYTVDSNGTAVETDSDGNIALNNLLLDPNIDGSKNNFDLNLDPNEPLLTGNGVYIDQTPHVEVVDIGANIKPLDPEIPVVSKDVNVSVATPDAPKALAAPVDPVAPGDVNVAVSTPVVNVVSPSAPTVPTVTPPAPINVNVNVNLDVNSPSVPDIPTYEPKVILPPAEPIAPVITPPVISPFEIAGESFGSGPAAFFLNNSPSINNHNTVISEIYIKQGDFIAKRKSSTGGFIYSFSNYKGYNIYTGTTSNETGTSGGVAMTGVPTQTGATIDDVSTPTTTGTQAVGMMRTLNQGMVNNGNWEYIWKEKLTKDTYVKELVHYDVHGNIPIATYHTNLVTAGASAELLDAYDYASSKNETGVTPTRSTQWTNTGKITVKGSNATVTNQYFHGDISTSQVMHINNGKILLEDGNYNTVFMTAGNTDRKSAGVIMYNGSKGEIIINTGSSAGYAYAKPASNNTNRAAIVGNDGVFTLAGDDGAAIYVGHTDYNGTNNKVVLFDDPVDRGSGNDTGMMYIFGDNSLGLYVPKDASMGVISYNVANGVAGSGKGIRIAVGGYDAALFPDAKLDDGITESAVGMAVYQQKGTTTAIDGNSYAVVADYHELHVNGNSKASVGAYALANAPLYLGNGVISVNGGEGNIGAYAKDANIITTGDIIAGNGKVKQHWIGAQDGTGIKIDAVAVQGTDNTAAYLGVADNDNLGGFAGTETFVPSDNTVYYDTPSVEVIPNYFAAEDYYELPDFTPGLENSHLYDVNVGAYAGNGKEIKATNLGGMGSQNTIGLFATGSGSKIEITGDTEIIGMTVVGADQTVTNSSGTITLNSNATAMAAFATDDAEITLNNSRKAGTDTFINTATTPVTVTYYNKYPDISVTGMESSIAGNYVGMGLFASAGGQITAKDMYIEVSQGAAGVVSIGGTNPSKIDVTDSTIYSDNGYALYTKDGGTIDATNTTLVLDGVDFEDPKFDKDHDGKSDITGNDNMSEGSIVDGFDDITHKKLVDELSATAMEIPMDTSSNGITFALSSSNNIYIKSNQVVVYNLTHLPSGGKNLNALKTDIDAKAPYVITDDGIHKTWKLAAIDGGKLNVTTNVIESLTNSGSTLSDEDIFFHRLLMQNSKIEISTTGIVKSDIDGIHMNNYDEGDVAIAVKMTSANTDKLVNKNTSEIINNGTIIAARTDSLDAVKGSIGAYMNYGKVTNEGSINIEDTSTSSYTREGGIGIAGVNGSNIINNGDITVGHTIMVLGKEKLPVKMGIGIASLAYKEEEMKDTSTKATIYDPRYTGLGLNIPIYKASNYDPFTNSTAVDDGKTKIENKGTITVIGDGSVGIYGRNNDRRSIESLGISDGKVEIINEATGIIDASAGKGALGIVAIGNGAGNNLNPLYWGDTTVNNKGIIKVGKNGFGIYADGAYDYKLSMDAAAIAGVTTRKDVYSPGNVIITMGASGIAGKLDLIGDEAIGIYMDENTYLTGDIEATNSIGTNTKDKIVVYLKSSKKDDVGVDVHVINYNTSIPTASLSSIISSKIDMSASQNTVGIAARDRLAGYSGVMTLGDADNITNGYNSIGIYADDSIATTTAGSIINVYGHDITNATFGTGIGMYTENGALANRSGATINLGDAGTPDTDSNQIGMIVKGTLAHTMTVSGANINGVINGGFAYNNGVINFNSSNSNSLASHPAQVGIYAEDGAYASLNGANGRFNFNGNNAFGVVAKDATVGIATSVDHSPTSLIPLLSSISWGIVEHNPGTGKDNNILVLAQDGSKIVNQGLIVGDQTGTNSSPTGTIGVFLSGDNNMYEDYSGSGLFNLLGGSTAYGLTGTGYQLTVFSGAIGVYSNGNNKLQLNADVHAKASLTDNFAIGTYVNGESELEGTMNITGDTGSSAIGIYGENGEIKLSDRNNDSFGMYLTLNDTATGMYMINGAYAKGATINVTNNSTVTNAGIYYDGVAKTHSTDIILNGSNVIAIFANNNADMKTDGSITESGPGDHRYALLAGESGSPATSAKVTNQGTITFNSPDSILMYTENGVLVNEGELNSTGTTTGTEGAMVGIAKAAADIVNIINNKIINVKDSFGIVAKRDVTGATVNANNTTSAEINVTADTKGSIGVAMIGDSTGTNMSYTGTGTINVTGNVTVGSEMPAIGLYTKDTVASQITSLDDLTLANAKSVGVFAENSVVDYDVNVLSGNDGVEVYATGGTSGVTSLIGNTIDGTNLTGGAALFVNDGNSGVVINGVTVKVGQNSLGILLNKDYALSNVVIDDDLKTSSTGVYVNKGTNSSIETGTDIHVGKGNLGIYVDGNGALSTTLNLNDGYIDIDADGTSNGVGIFNSGVNATTLLGVNGTNYDVTFKNPNAILAYNKFGALTIGDNLTIHNDGTLSFVYDGDLENLNTNIVANNGQTAFFGQYKYDVNDTSANHYMKNSGNITVNAGGTGMSVLSDGTYVGALSLENAGTMTVDGVKAVGLSSNYGDVTNSGTMAVTNNGTGIFVSDEISSVNLGNNTINVTSGIGMVINDAQNIPAVNSADSMILNNGTTSNYSIGTYYLSQGETGASTISDFPKVTQGDNTITAVIDGKDYTSNKHIHVTPAVTTPATGINQIGLYITDVTSHATPTPTNDVDVSLDGGVNSTGDTSIGVFAANNSSVKIPNAITVGNSTQDLVNPYTPAAVGVYAKDSTIDANTQTLTVGANSIGITGDNSIVNIGIINAAYKAIGVYTKKNTTTTVDTSIDAGVSAYGVFAEDSTVNATNNVSMHVSDGTAIGILSQGTGNVSFTGNATVDAKDATGTDKASIAIYKGNGTGTITTAGTMNIGKGGYAVYAENKNYAGAGQTTVENSAHIVLGESSVGIYANGNMNIPSNVSATNYGTIDVGTSYKVNADHTNDPGDLNGVGMYIGHGAAGYNDASGNINVPYDHSVGVYVRGSENSSEDGTNKTLTVFTNDGHIFADAGGVGVLAKGYTKVINNGIVETGYNKAKLADGVTDCPEAETIGIAAYGSDQDHKATVVNNGTVQVGDGVGIYLNKFAVLENNGKIIFDKGTGITADPSATITSGAGSQITKLNPSSTGTPLAISATEFPHGAINLLDDGTVVINNQFVHAGVIVADNLIVDGVQVDITRAPSFEVSSIEGNITLLPNFITTGNGYAWTVDNFVNNINQNAPNIVSPTLNVITSPLYDAHITNNGGLTVAKQPYAYLVAGTQFDNLYNGVDSLLALDQAGKGNDSTVLKNLNAYLEGLYDPDDPSEFYSEADRTLAEMRGDIYSTIQKRMANVQNAFDTAFDEMNNSYDFTRDTGKYSVIYQQGKLRDNTLGIDDYDYRVQGLMYMKEEEGRKVGDKHGFTVGFAVSRFDFDDAPTTFDKSKEDVYSLRAGVHNVHAFDTDEADTLRLVSRLEVGYNRHEATRSMELGDTNGIRTYKNKGHYDTYQLTLDNRLEKDLYRNVKTKVRGYVGLDLEYGYIHNFTETSKGDSALELDVKKNDYFSVQPNIGVKAEHRVYVGKKVSAKLTGDLAYAYELGDNYSRNKARVHGGTEGYYSLIKPAKEKGIGKAKVGLTIEKADHCGVTFEVGLDKHQNKKKEDVRFGVRFNYKFMN